MENKYGYAYFDKNGTLKEFIIDPSLREGNQGINKIYVFIESIGDFDYLALSYINTDLEDAEWSAPIVVSNSVTSNFNIPVMKDFDPKFFRYGKQYQGYLITLPTEVLQQNGNVAISLLAFKDNDDSEDYDEETDTPVLYMGLITLHVTLTGASFQVNLDKSQYYLLLKEFSKYYTKEQIDQLFIDNDFYIIEVSGTNGVLTAEQKQKIVDNPHKVIFKYSFVATQIIYMFLDHIQGSSDNLTYYYGNNEISQYIIQKHYINVSSNGAWTHGFHTYRGEVTTNKVNSLNDSSTNYPTTHAVKEYVDQFGYSLEMSIDSEYDLVIKLKDKNGNVISTQDVDLPIEQMIVDAEYDSETQEIILTLDNGETLEIPIGDLVEGLVSQDYLEANYYSKTQSDERYTKKEDVLPTISIDAGDNVLSVINQYNLNNKTVLLKISAAQYLGKFSLLSDSNYNFEFEVIGSKTRYYSSITNLTGLTFNNIFSPIYQEDYALDTGTLTELETLTILRGN